MEPACDSCYSMSFLSVGGFRRMPHRSRPPLGKLAVIQARLGKALQDLAQDFGLGIRTIRTWIRL